MLLAVYSLSFLAISQLLFMGLINLVYFRNKSIGLLFALLSICLISVIIVLLPTIKNDFWGWKLLIQLAYGTPAVLWIIAYSWFEDDQEISISAWSILLGYQIMILIARSSFADGKQAFFYMMLVAYACMLGFTLHVIILSIKGRNVDLIEHRRRMRAPFAIGLSIILGVVLVIGSINLWSEVDKSQDPVFSLILASYTAIFLSTLAMNLASFGLYGHLPALTNFTEASTASSANEQASDGVINPRILSRINELMDSKELYRDPNLTIKELAINVFVAEHKMRRIINQGMGFKNFNQFLNQYRINKAKKLLISAHQTPIYTIALEVGFASLSSFNKAFKEITSITPSEFKKRRPQGD